MEDSSYHLLNLSFLKKEKLQWKKFHEGRDWSWLSGWKAEVLETLLGTDFKERESFLLLPSVQINYGCGTKY